MLVSVLSVPHYSDPTSTRYQSTVATRSPFVVPTKVRLFTSFSNFLIKNIVQIHFNNMVSYLCIKIMEKAYLINV